MADQQRPRVTHNSGESRFELEENSEARLEYRLENGAIWFVHTEVPEAMEGQGVGAALARAGLEYAKESGLPVVPRCPFIATYIRRHPEYQELVLT